MNGASDFPLRLRNRMNRLTRRIPTGVVHPAVPDDVFAAHVSLFDFLAAFTLRKSVLITGEQPYAAAHLAGRGALSVTARVSSPSVLRFARREYAGGPVELADAVEPTRRFDVVIRTDPPWDRAVADSASVSAGGTLLLSLPPSVDATAILTTLRQGFVSVRRFAHTCHEAIDLSSPARSVLTPFSFRFSEVHGNLPVPANTLGVVVMATNDVRWSKLQLHIGCGPVALPGWINVDNQPYEGVDFLWDAARGIPFRDARLIFAEHFIEHLSYAQGAQFAARCREILADDGVLRLSTPNLDWVWIVSYRPQDWKESGDALRDCFMTNRAFRGWGHQFLYNLPALSAMLRNAGFADVVSLPYGESSTPALAGIEHHQRYPDLPEHQHVIVVEASGRHVPAAIEGEEVIREYERDVAVV